MWVGGKVFSLPALQRFQLTAGGFLVFNAESQRTQRNAEDDSVNSAVLSALCVSAMRTITARKRSRSLVSMLGSESCNSVHSSEFLSEESFSYFCEPVRDVAHVELQVRLQLACVAHVLFVEQALHGYCGGFS